MTTADIVREAFGPPKRVFILVNGILNNPGASDGWTDRGVTWLNIKTEGKAEKFEYACGAITRRLRQQQRAEAIARMCDYYFHAGYEITLIGHSNGCDLIARVLEIHQAREFASVHLFAPAADAATFEWAVGLWVNRVFLYVSANDQALKWGGLTRKLFGWAGLGYGSLGREVPAFFEQDTRCLVTRRDDYGHSTWFERGAHFETTMRLIIENESTPLK